MALIRVGGAGVVRHPVLSEHAGELSIATIRGEAFYLKSVAPPRIKLPQIFRSFLPFMGIQVMVLMLIPVVPQIKTLFL